MKRIISFLIVGLAGLAALVSCNVGLENFPQPSKKHTVYFTTGENSPVTKTGITIDNNTVTPDWRLTKAENVHLFEYQAANTVSVGEDVEIAIGADNLTATFKADFPEDMTIIVDPTDPEPDPSGAKGGSNGAKASASYTYAAVIAQQGEAKDLSFIVPAVQYPDANTLIDPDADFLIGYNGTAVTEPHDYEENVVDLYFDRPVALGRLSLTNFFGTDEFVKSVTIAAQGGMSGSAGLGDIDFANSSVSFTADAEGGITLSYGKNGQAVSDGAFAAYFVSLPGEVTLTSIEVVTDQYCYTKTFDGGKALSLSNGSFKNLKLDLSTAAREAATPESNTWYKASVLEDGIDYLIVSGGQALKNNGSKAVVAAQSVEIVDGTISLEETDGIIWTANANSEFTEYGTHTLNNGTEHLWRHSDNGTFTLEANNEAVTKYMVWNYDGEYLWNISIYTSGTSTTVSEYYAYYSSGWKISTTKTAATLYTSRAPQELAFSPAASAEYDLATESWTVVVPALTGAYTPVTYALSDDSNPAVATVDADGTVHPLSRGTVTVVASAAGNAQYQAASASYTLRVVDSSVTTNTYIKVTSTADLEVGAQYLLVYESTPSVFKPILDGSTFKKHTDNVQSVTISSNSITSTELVDYELTLTDGYYLYVASAGRYIYPLFDGSQTTSLEAESSPAHNLTVTINNDGTAKITNAASTASSFTWSTRSSYFSSTTSATADINVCLYKLDDGRLPQTLSFSPAEVNYDMAGSAALVKPTLSNAIGTVTYSSSDEAIASVDRSSGDVTVKKKGTVVITASAAGNSQYKPGSASYTLVITDSSSTTPVWYKAEEIEANETYLIISHDYALNNNGTSGGEAVLLTGVGETVEYDAPETMIWTATNESSGKFRLTGNDGKVIRLSSSSFQIGTASGTESNNQWSLDTDGLVKSGDYFLYYSTSQSKWAVSNSASDSHTGYLYASSPGRAARNLEFSSTSVIHDLATQGTNFEEPTLSGVTEGVEYSSNNTSIATVDATSGEVTLAGKTGFVVITASAPKTDAFKAETVSYTLRVTDSSAPVTEDTYVKVTSASDLVAGEKYILVYEDGSKVFKPTLNGSNFTTTGNALDVAISGGTIVSDDFKDCQMTLESGYYFYVASVSRYLYPTYNNMGAEEAKSSSHSFNISISNGTATISRTSNNSTYNLRYSTSSSYFQSSTSSANVALYKLTEGSNPGGGDDPTPSTSTYSRVSFATGITTGKYLIVNPSDAQVFTTVTSYPNSASVSPSNGVISGDYASYEVTITKSGDNYTIQNGSGQYLYYVYTSGDTETRVAYKSDAENWAASSVSSDANGFDLNCSGGSGRQHIYWNNSTAGTFFKLGSQSTGVHLYKKADNP